MAAPEDSAPLPALPASGQEDWFAPRNAFDAEVRRRLEGYLSPDQLDAAIGGVAQVVAIRQTGNRVAALGTSSLNLGTGYVSAADYGLSARDIIAQGDMLSGGRIVRVYPSVQDVAYGASGQTLAELVSTGAVTAAAASDADVIVFGGYANSLTDATLTAADIVAQHFAIVDTLVAAGKKVIPMVFHPRKYASDTAATKQKQMDVATMLRQLAPQHPGVVGLIDMYSIMLDPTTGMSNAAWMFDDYHVNAIGALRCGYAVAEVFEAVFPPVHDFANDNTDKGNAITNGLMVGTAGTKSGTVLPTGTVADAYVVASLGSPTSVVASKVARTDMQPGEWQQLAVDAGAAPAVNGAQLRLTNQTTGDRFAPGDTIRATVEVEIDQAAAWDARNLSINLVAQNAAGAALVTTRVANQSSGDRTALPGSLPRYTKTLTIRSMDLTLPADVGRVQVNLTFYGTGTIRVGRVRTAKVV